MPKPNLQFELSPDDLDLIETALLARKRETSLAAEGSHCEDTREIHDLLGRLHNQKTFFRPAKGPYIGG